MRLDVAVSPPIPVHCSEPEADLGKDLKAIHLCAERQLLVIRLHDPVLQRSTIKQREQEQGRSLLRVVAGGRIDDIGIEKAHDVWVVDRSVHLDLPLHLLLLVRAIAIYSFERKALAP